VESLTAGVRLAGGDRFPFGRPGDLPQGFGTDAGLPNVASSDEKARRTRAGVTFSAESGFCQGKWIS